MRSSARALLLMSRTLDGDISAKDLEEDYDIDENELSFEQIKNIFSQNNIQSDVLKIHITQLINFLKHDRVLLRLNNDRTIIATKSYSEEGADYVVVVDPTDSDLQPKPINVEDLSGIWSGQSLVAKKAPKDIDKEDGLSLGWLLTRILSRPKVLVPILLLSVMGHIISLTPIILLIITLDKVIGYEGVSTLYVLVFGVSISFAFGALFRFLRDKSILIISQGVQAYLSKDVMISLLNLSLPEALANESLVAQLIGRVDKIKLFTKTFLSKTMYDLAGFVVFIPLLVAFSIELFFVLLVFTGLGMAVSRYAETSIKNHRRRTNFAKAGRNGMYREVVQGSENIKALGIEAATNRKWVEAEGKFIEEEEVLVNQQNLWREITSLLQNFLSVSVLFFGALLVLNESIPVGAMLAFYLLSQKVYMPLTNLVGVFSEFKDVDSELKSLEKIVATEKKRVSRGVKPNLLGGVSYKHVNFGYPGGPLTLKDVNLDISPLSFVGITGPSGSGKTTLIKLLQKFYMPRGGILRLDQSDLRTINPSYLRSNISVVSANNYFPKASIKENLFLPLTSENRGRLDWAIKKVGASDFVNGLDDGVDTILEANAGNISSGQRQLLALARGLINNPRILVIDDALTALGPEQEMEMLSALKDIRVGRTVIIISSQIWHFQNCDQIIVMDRGEVIQTGNWADLTMQDGYFKTNLDKQNAILSVDIDPMSGASKS